MTNWSGLVSFNAKFRKLRNFPTFSYVVLQNQFSTLFGNIGWKEDLLHTQTPTFTYILIASRKHKFVPYSWDPQGNSLVLFFNPACRVLVWRCSLSWNSRIRNVRLCNIFIALYFTQNCKFYDRQGAERKNDVNSTPTPEEGYSPPALLISHHNLIFNRAMQQPHSCESHTHPSAKSLSSFTNNLLIWFCKIQQHGFQGVSIILATASDRRLIKAHLRQTPDWQCLM